ncbi:hypothetical protein [Agrobacterium tumefaciens]|uniref:hypothetical protein n=1 Tax=Agrobacterium tumefaciens TaxID=358 RepID=UPI00287E7A72|nr:hypothetical protein [Agrobacterium tumefaciens]MDS7594085.1 hypothetical protein [Agrobacterium tumefaciens]
MLEALLVYLGDTQREGRMVTRRLRANIVLWTLIAVFFLIALIAGVVAGSIYLSDYLGAGPAALVVAGTAFLLGVIMLVILAIIRRPRAYAPRAAAPLATPIAAAPLALQSALTLAMQARPYATLALAVAAGFLATRANTKKTK